MSTNNFNELLSVMQLSDSFFPTGLYTNSNGLEILFYEKKVNDSDKLLNLIKALLTQQIGPADCVALGSAYEFAKKNNIRGIIDVDQTIYMMKVVREIREASTRSGRQLIKCLTTFVKDNRILDEYQNAIKDGLTFGSYPVAFAIACNVFEISKEKAGLMMLYGFSVSIIGAAMRLGILEHFKSQRLIDELKPTITMCVENYIDRSLSNMWQFAPEVDIVQISHEKLDSKMFIT
ncbi:MAG: urease accessory UreF family protein [Nitrososphaerales archaeon]